jgi:simple sugar transport system permease protein
MTTSTEQLHPADTGPPARSRGAQARSARALAMRALTLREGSIVVVTILAAIYFTIQNDRFFTSSNLENLLPYFAPFAILAAGEVMVMVAGEIDLSIGSVGLFAPLMYYEFNGLGLGLWANVVLSLLCCAAIGVLNGVLIEVFGISSFVATLGTLLGVGGLTLIVSHAAPVNMPGAQVTSKVVNVKHVVNGHTITLQEHRNSVGTFANVFGAGTYSEVLWALIIVITLQLVLTITRWGMYTIAVGGNRLAAAEAGIKVRAIVIRNFVLCATLAGFVGILEAVRTSTVTPDTAGASETMFRAVSAAVIGGTLLVGGVGTAIGALIGALFLGILRDGLVLDGIDADYLDFILGIAILVAMAINIYIGRTRTRSGRAG